MTRREADAMNARAVAAYARLGRSVPPGVPYRDWGNLHRTRPNERLLPKRWPAECGTESGCKRHYRRGETPCDACKEANAEAKRQGTGTRRGRQAA